MRWLPNLILLFLTDRRTAIMKTAFSMRCKWVLLLSATLSLNVWSADAVEVHAGKSDSIELTNLGATDTAESAATAKDTTSEIQANAKIPASRTPSVSAEASREIPLPRKEDEGTSFSNVGLPGAVSAADFDKHGSPANYRELVLNKAMVNRNENPNALRRYLAVDRATYQARIAK
jgi:hypothetical protein